MLALKCETCSNTFYIDVNEKNFCPYCGKPVSEKAILTITCFCNQMYYASETLHDMGWSLYFPVENSSMNNIAHLEGKALLPLPIHLK